ncbi:MAG TPA: MBL fold metallo-hydrolase [Tepidisphaeraceae bacterium]|jgi:glyoxylase-like metal-dependent hydrolase (beta-lactamase superfamily II)|nr:MBL fold metallo-hydrolase [Tepidisphaeraceae bacterium]
MQILSNTGGIAATNSYLIADENSGQAVLFDAPDHTVAPLLEVAKKRNWEIVGLWLTHGHFDHVADHAVLTEKFPKARVLIHRLDEPKLIEPNSLFFPLPFEIPPRNADGYVEDGQAMKIGALELNVIHTPGHSPGHVAYHFPRQNILIGGDLIMMNSVGRTDFPDSDFGQLQESLRRVMKLPIQTRLLPGHGPTSTLAEEAARNPYVIEAMSAG